MWCTSHALDINMKNILYFLFLPLSLFAQRETKTDTTWIENTGGQFFGVRRIVYQNNEEAYTKTLIGDTARLAQNQVDRIITQAQSMAQDARTVSNFRKQLAGLVRESNAVESASGVSPMDTVQKRYAGKFLVPGWTIRQNGAITNISFAVNNAGNFRYTIQGSATRGADLFGSVMILNGYPTQGNQIELYENSEGNYMNIDRSVVVRTPGSTANLAGSGNRAADGPPIIEKSEPAQQAPVKTPPQKPKKKKKSPRI